MSTNTKWVKLTGALLCTVFGAAVFILGVWLALYDIGHGSIVATTFLVAIIGAIIFIAGINTLAGGNYGAKLAFVGSALMLSLSVIAAKGHPEVFFRSAYAPIALIGVVMPLVVGGFSLWAMFKEKRNNGSDA